MSTRLHTRNLSTGESLQLTPSEGVLQISWAMSTDTGDNGTLLGNFPFKAANESVAVESQPILIPAGGGNTFVCSDPKKPLECTMTCNQGTLKIIIGF